MRKIMNVIIILLVIMCLADVACAKKNKKPTHFGMWAVKDGEWVEIKSRQLKYSSGKRGLFTKDMAESFDLVEDDKIYYFFGDNPLGNIYADVLEWQNEISLYTVKKRLNLNVMPSGYIGGAPLYEIQIDSPNSGMSFVAIHFGALTSSFSLSALQIYTIIMTTKEERAKMQEIFKGNY